MFSQKKNKKKTAANSGKAQQKEENKNKFTPDRGIKEKLWLLSKGVLRTPTVYQFCSINFECYEALLLTSHFSFLYITPC